MECIYNLELQVCNYHPSAKSVKYKARRNGLPVIIQISPLQVDASFKYYEEARLCPGVEEEDVQPDVKMNMIYIEKIEGKVIYRSRDCDQLIPNSDMCHRCRSLRTIQKFDFKSNGKNSEDESLVQKDDVFQKDDGNDDEVKSSQSTVIKILKKEPNVYLPSESLVCSICSKSFATKGSLSHHERMHDPCPFCGQNFPSKSAEITNHLTREHYDLKDSPEYIAFLEERLKKFICQDCGTPFSSNRALWNHQLRSHSSQVNSEFKCSICDTKYINKYGLKIHMKKHDNISELCTVCGKEFTNQRDLKGHLRNHESRLQKKKCKIPGCGAEFKYQVQLRIHQDEHSNIWRYPCHLCNKKYHKSTFLREHIISFHEKRKPYFCEQCEFRTATHNNLNIHRSKMHQSERISLKKYKSLVLSGEHPFCKELDLF